MVSQIPDTQRHDDERQQAMPGPGKHIETKAGEVLKWNLPSATATKPSRASSAGAICFRDISSEFPSLRDEMRP